MTPRRNVAVVMVADDPATSEGYADSIIDCAIAAGHRIAGCAYRRMDEGAIRTQLITWISDRDVDLIVACGGIEKTSTPRALAPLVTARLGSLDAGGQILRCGSTLVIMLTANATVASVLDGALKRLDPPRVAPAPPPPAAAQPGTARPAAAQPAAPQPFASRPAAAQPAAARPAAARPAAPQPASAQTQPPSPPCAAPTPANALPSPPTPPNPAPSPPTTPNAAPPNAAPPSAAPTWPSAAPIPRAADVTTGSIARIGDLPASGDDGGFIDLRAGKGGLWTLAGVGLVAVAGVVLLGVNITERNRSFLTPARSDTSIATAPPPPPARNVAPSPPPAHLAPSPPPPAHHVVPSSPALRVAPLSAPHVAPRSPIRVATAPFAVSPPPPAAPSSAAAPTAAVPPKPPASHVATAPRPRLVAEHVSPPGPLAPAPIDDGGCDEATCSLHGNERECCTPFRATSIPANLDRAMVAEAIAGVKTQVLACGTSAAGTGVVKIRAQVGGDGRVVAVSIDEAPEVSIGNCVLGVIRATPFRRSVAGGSFAYRFEL